MMSLFDNWFVLALIAPVVYAAINFFDKYLVSEKVKGGRGVIIYSSVVAFAFGLGLWLALGMPLHDWRDTGLIMLTGALVSYALIFYYEALSSNDTSKVLLLIEMIPAITLLLAFSFLGESVSGKQLIGFVFILAASIGYSFFESDTDELFSSNEKRVATKKKRFGLSRLFWLMMGVDVLYACSYVLVKFVSGNYDFSVILIYESFGMAFGGLSYYCCSSVARKSFHESVLVVGKGVLGLMVISEIFFITAKALTFRAIALGPVSIVSLLGNTQPFYVVVFGVVLTLLFPTVFREDIRKKTLMKKILVGAALMAGVWLVQI